MASKRRLLKTITEILASVYYIPEKHMCKIEQFVSVLRAKGEDVRAIDAFIEFKKEIERIKND